MRLNLPRYNCIHFAILGEFTVSRDADVEIQAFMERTEARTIDLDGEVTRVALFGSRSTTAGVTYGVQGRLYRSLGENDSASFQLWMIKERASDELPKPPSTMRPVSHLVDAAARYFGAITVTCNAMFEYDKAVYQSRVRFPAPLLIESDDSGVTHLEQAKFSRRVNDEIEYQISVDEGPHSIGHSVEYGGVGKVDNRSMSKLLDRASAISSRLVRRTEEDDTQVTA